MNRLENWFCGSWLWRWATAKYVLPSLLRDGELGDHVLELGAGLGAGTEFLQRHTQRLTSLEYDAAFVRKLRTRFAEAKVSVVQGDAAALPFAADTFSAAVATLVLHHLPSEDQQNRALAEVRRVLRPGPFLGSGNSRQHLEPDSALPGHVRANGSEDAGDAAECSRILPHRDRLITSGVSLAGGARQSALTEAEARRSIEAHANE